MVEVNSASDDKVGYTYLGIPTFIDGNQKVAINMIKQKLLTKVKQFNKSGLSTFNLLDAIHSCICSNLSYYAPLVYFTQKYLNNMDVLIRQMVKETLSIGTTIALEWITLPRKSGGLGITPFTFSYHSNRVSFCLERLNCEDRNMRRVAIGLLLKACRHTGSLLYRQSQNMKISFGAKVVTIKSKCLPVFSEMLKTCARYNLTIARYKKADLVLSKSLSKKFSHLQHIWVAIYDGTIIYDANEAMKSSYISRLELSLSFKKQGAWFNTPNGLSKYSKLLDSRSKRYNFKISFLLRARSETLGTNSRIAIFDKSKSSICSLCRNGSETVAHMTNMCNQLAGMYTERHDLVVEFILKQVYRYGAFTSVTCNQQFKQSGIATSDGESLKPDFVLFNKYNGDPNH
jgi:hypothetical protein